MFKNKLRLTNDKRGIAAMNQLGALAVGVAVLAISLIVTFVIMAQARVQIGEITGTNTSNHTGCMDSYACNATAALQVAVDDIPGYVPIIIIAVIGGVLLSLVALYRSRD